MLMEACVLLCVYKDVPSILYVHMKVNSMEIENALNRKCICYIYGHLINLTAYYLYYVTSIFYPHDFVDD